MFPALGVLGSEWEGAYGASAKLFVLAFRTRVPRTCEFIFARCIEPPRLPFSIEL